jgi:hypothetical protein
MMSMLYAPIHSSCLDLVARRIEGPGEIAVRTSDTASGRVRSAGGASPSAAP